MVNVKTETVLKLQDAASQMRLAIANLEDETIFRSCINAFLSHARSVTLVMQVENQDAERKAWYAKRQSEMAKNPLLKFFNSSRVYSVHRGVVRPQVTTIPVESWDFWVEESETGRKRWRGTTVVATADVQIDDVYSVAQV